jgi:hypothetical protein
MEDRTMTKSEALMKNAGLWVSLADGHRKMRDCREAAWCYKMAATRMRQALEALKAERLGAE